MRENTDQNNSEYGNFLRNVHLMKRVNSQAAHQCFYKQTLGKILAKVVPFQDTRFLPWSNFFHSVENRGKPKISNLERKTKFFVPCDNRKIISFQMTICIWK